MEHTVVGAEDPAFIPCVALVANSWIIDFAYNVCYLFWGEIATHIQVQNTHTSYLLV